MKKTERITICVDSETKENFRILAENSGVSMSALGRVMLNIGKLIEDTIKESVSSLSLPSMEVGLETEEEVWTLHKKKTKRKVIVGGYAKRFNDPLLNEIRDHRLFKNAKQKLDDKPIVLADLNAPPRAPIVESLFMNI